MLSRSVNFVISERSCLARYICDSAMMKLEVHMQLFFSYVELSEISLFVAIYSDPYLFLFIIKCPFATWN